jgi:predicted Zn-dependent protease
MAFATGMRDLSDGTGRAMAEKSRKRLMLEKSLSEDPGDLFLKYGLAMQCLRDGEVGEGRQRLRALIEEDPARQIAAYHQLGQSLADEGENEEARKVLGEGIARAKAVGDWHAAGEMDGILQLSS